MESQPKNPEFRTNPENFHPCNFNPFQKMDFSIQLQTVKSGWTIVYIEGSQVIISPQRDFFLRRLILSCKQCKTLMKCTCTFVCLI